MQNYYKLGEIMLCDVPGNLQTYDFSGYSNLQSIDVNSLVPTRLQSLDQLLSLNNDRLCEQEPLLIVGHVSGENGKQDCLVGFRLYVSRIN